MKFFQSVAMACLVGSATADQNQFTIHSVVDPESGLPAYHYLLPSGWNVSDTLTWDKQNRLAPVTFTSTLTSLDGATKIQMLPPETNSFAVKGGSLTGVLPPSKAIDALDAAFAHFHPKTQAARKDFAKDFEVPFEVGEGVKSIGLCGVLQVSFKEGDKDYTEYMSATMYEVSKQDPNGDTEGTWRIANAFAVTAPVADFKKAYTTFASVASSEGVTPKFLQLMLQAMSTAPGSDLDVKSLAAAGGKPGQEVMAVFDQNAKRHQQAIEKMFPVFHKPTSYKTGVGPMLLFGSFAVFGDSSGNIIADDNPGATPPTGYKLLGS